MAPQMRKNTLKIEFIQPNEKKIELWKMAIGKSSTVNQPLAVIVLTITQTG